MKFLKQIAYCFPVITILFICFHSTGELLFLSGDDWNKYKELGDRVSNELQAELKKQLVDAIKTGDVKGAVETCSKKAQSITIKVQKRFNSISSLKRVSRKYRNPYNAPGKLDNEVLQYLEKVSIGRKRIQEPVLVMEGKSVVYYRPLYVKRFCLKCHGKIIDPAVLKVIRKNYPGDRATGFKEGDLRGAIKVIFKGDT